LSTNVPQVSVSKYGIIEALNGELERGIEEKNSQISLAILQYCAAEQILFTQENIDSMIKTMVKTGFQDGIVYKHLVGMLRQAYLK
jgi:hypothetical protein